MADTKALPVFAFTDDRIQLQQLRAYMREHGSSINEEGLFIVLCYKGRIVDILLH